MMKKILDLVPFMIGGSEKFQRNFKSLAGANAIAQILGVVSLPLLTRLFSPEDFGILAVYTACQSVLLAVASARIEWLAPNARTRSEAIALIGVGLMALASSCLTILLITAALGAQIGLQLGVTSKDSWIFILLPLGVMAGGLQLLIQSWHVYQTELKIVGRSKLAQSFSTLLLSVLSGVGGAGASGLLLSYISGFWVAVGILVNRQKDFFRLIRRISFTRILKSANLSKKDAGFAVSLGLVNVILLMSPTIMISIFYDTKTVGLYSLVFKVATAPIGLFSTALVHSFWTDAAHLAKNDPQQLRFFYNGAIKRLGVLAALATPFFVAAPYYVDVIFGTDEWDGAGVLLAAITPYLVGMIMFSPTTHLIVYNKQHWQLGIDLLTLASSFLVFSLIATNAGPAWLALLGSSTIMLLGYLLRMGAHFVANSQAVRKFEKARSS